MDIRVDLKNSGIDLEELEKYRGSGNDILDALWSGREDGTGWVKWPLNPPMEEIEKIQNVAALMQGLCKKMIVIGIGGSYLGAKAVVEALVGNDEIYGEDTLPASAYPEIEFAGTGLSATELSKYVRYVEDYDTCLCVISKSGSTLETHIAFEVLKAALRAKYGEEKVRERIVVITQGTGGRLREESDREGYISFEIPEDIGGRYSVMTPVGLFPMAVSGIDIKEFISGGAMAAGSPAWDRDGIYYGIARHILQEKGKAMEIFQYYEPQLNRFALWLKQLFAESEGKSERGLYPDVLEMSKELHSMGQYLQEGRQMFFETIINIEKPAKDIVIPAGSHEIVEGKSLNEINRITMEGVIEAHRKINIPIIRIDIPEIRAYYLGQLFYFFEVSCSISAMLQGLNPFDQMGVELYKKEQKTMLEGYRPKKC